MTNHPNRSRTAKLLAEAKTTAEFLEHLSALLATKGMSGQAGNCIIRAHAIRAAIAKVEGRDIVRAAIAKAEGRLQSKEQS